MYQGDVVVYNVEKKAQLIVDIKNQASTSVEWAQKLHRNLLTHFGTTNDAFFLLALPDFLYLWKPLALPQAALEAPPDYVINTYDALALYFGENFQMPERISRIGFEMLITSWLQNLTNSPIVRDDKNLDWLFDSGLYEVIKNSSVVIQTNS